MVLTAARLVCTNRDRVSELSHVWGVMDQFLDYSNGWTLERAAAKGFKFLVQHLALKVSAESPTPNNKLLVMDFAAATATWAFSSGYTILSHSTAVRHAPWMTRPRTINVKSSSGCM